MQSARDDELEGAVAGLLGLHSRSSRPAPKLRSAPQFNAVSASSTRTAYRNSWVGASSTSSLYPTTTDRIIQPAIFAAPPCSYPFYLARGVLGPTSETKQLWSGYLGSPATASRLATAQQNDNHVQCGPGPWTADPRHLMSMAPDPGPANTFRSLPMGAWALHNRHHVATIPAAPLAQRRPLPSPVYPAPAMKPPLPQARQDDADNQYQICDVLAERQDGQQKQQQKQQKQQQKQQKQQQKQQQQKQQQQQREQPNKHLSIDQLWRLIPGSSTKVELSQRETTLDISRHGSGGSFSAKDAKTHNNVSTPHACVGRGAQQSKSDHELSGRQTVHDVHQPLSNRQRMHRARAVARLRTRRRALVIAEAAAAAGRAPGGVKRRLSDTTVEIESSDSENDRPGGIESKEADTAGSKSGSDMSSRRSSGRDGSETTRASSESFMDVRRVVAGARDPRKKLKAKSLDITDSSNTTSTGTPSKVGDLFELMRSVSVNAAAAALAVEGGGRRSNGEADEIREVGRPVKYKYRQEAARSRKRTRGRFVSEKAPAFVSITELMATRKAEREQQEQQDTAPVPVGAG